MNSALPARFRALGYRPIRLAAEGFTLVELMVALAVLAILLGIAVPGFQSTFAGKRLLATTNDLVAALHLIRLEAIRKNHRVTLCRSADGTSCQTSSGTWADGWIMFDDSVNDASKTDATIDAGEAVLRIGASAPSGISILGNGPVNNYVSYASDSSAKTTTGAFQAGTIRVCSTSSSLGDDERTRDIVINSVGRIIVRKTSNISSACPSP